MHNRNSRWYIFVAIFAPQIVLCMLIEHFHFNATTTTVGLRIQCAITSAYNHTHAPPITVAILTDPTRIMPLSLVLKRMDSCGPTVARRIMAMVILVTFAWLWKVPLVVLHITIHNPCHFLWTLRDEFSIGELQEVLSKARRKLQVLPLPLFSAQQWGRTSPFVSAPG
jgi:hypothetical protein